MHRPPWLGSCLLLFYALFSACSSTSTNDPATGGASGSGGGSFDSGSGGGSSGSGGGGNCFQQDCPHARYDCCIETNQHSALISTLKDKGACGQGPLCNLECAGLCAGNLLNGACIACLRANYPAVYDETVNLCGAQGTGSCQDIAGCLNTC